MEYVKNFLVGLAVVLAAAIVVGAILAYPKVFGIAIGLVVVYWIGAFASDTFF